MVPNTASRFWLFVKKSDDPNSCWEWTGCRNVYGYGAFRWTMKQMKAHRLAYELHHGVTLPTERLSAKSVVVMHTCDNPPCCNPAHLRLGTIGDNLRDCLAKGGLRPRKGERHHATTLQPDDVRTIRARRKAGHTQQAIANDYGITQGTVSHIERGLTWGHI